MRLLTVLACILLTFTITRLYDNSRMAQAQENQRLQVYCHSFGINDSAVCSKFSRE